jgi:hypothetical protein
LSRCCTNFLKPSFQFKNASKHGHFGAKMPENARQ